MNHTIVTKKCEHISSSIIRVGRSHAKGNTGEIFSIGITSTQMRLDAKKLGLDTSKQAALNQATVCAANELTLLKHLQYKETHYGPEYTNGTMTSLFDRKSNFTFKSRRGVTPSNAIKSIFVHQENPLITECSIAIQLIFYKTALDVLGENSFNKIFSEKPILLERKATSKNPIFAMSTIISQGNVILENEENILSKAIPGDLLYIKNIHSYLDKHPTGDSRGFNLVYLGRNATNEYEFGGLFTEKRPRTYDEIIDLMIEDYNKPPCLLRAQ